MVIQVYDKLPVCIPGLLINKTNTAMVVQYQHAISSVTRQSHVIDRIMKIDLELVAIVPAQSIVMEKPEKAETILYYGI